jgi:hypothetical protein
MNGNGTIVMAGLVPAIHDLCAAKTWMPGTSPGMTAESRCYISDLDARRIAEGFAA